MYQAHLNRRELLKAVGTALAASTVGSLLSSYPAEAAGIPEGTLRWFFQNEDLDGKSGFHTNVFLGVDSAGRTANVSLGLFGESVTPLAEFQGSGPLPRKPAKPLNINLTRTYGAAGGKTATYSSREIKRKVKAKVDFGETGATSGVMVDQGIDKPAYGELGGSWAGPFPLGGTLIVDLDSTLGAARARLIAGENTVLDVTGPFTPIKKLVSVGGGPGAKSLIILPKTVVNLVPQLQTAFILNHARLFNWVVENDTLTLTVSLNGSLIPLVLARQ